MKRVTGLMLAVSTLYCLWTTAAHAEKGFILLASTIGPIDAGIVSALEEGFEKETGIQSAASGLMETRPYSTI